MRATLHLLRESHDAADTDALENRLRAHGFDLRIFHSAEALAADLRATDCCVVCIAPDVVQPLPSARWLARHLPGLRFVFLLDAAHEAAFRKQAAYAAPAGGCWTAIRSDAADLEARIDDELARARQQRKLQSTLTRMKLQLPEPRVPDSNEYRRLVASDRYLASVLRHAHDAIVSLDRRGNVISWNRGAEQLFGLTLEQAQRRSFVTLFRQPEAAKSALDACLGGSFRTTGLELEHAGAIRHVDGNFGPLQDEEQHIVGAVAILRDNTERHHAEEELRANSKQKDEFLAMLAHELRNPLAPIRNATQILGMLSQQDPRAQQATQVIARQTDHMAALIEDLLDVARVTRGAVVLEREIIPLTQVVADAVEQARSHIESKRHRLFVSEASDALQVAGDRKRLTQVLANLLVNAAKYTPEGGEIRVELSGDEHQVVIAVSDNGLGMDAQLRARVFDLFVQGERTPDRAEGGLGIGLALVRSLVAMHGGAVAACSEGPGKGSRFEVQLPRAWPAGPQAAIAPSHALGSAAHPLHLMVVDDSEDAAQTLGILLHASGHHVDVETDPRSALVRAQRELPDAFILDIGMPHIDGYELARRIRSIPTGKRPVLIALTGYGHRSDRERAQSAGFDHHLVKPLEPQKLLELLDRIAVVQAG
jgi:PAS domain S-box-containing protein